MEDNNQFEPNSALNSLGINDTKMGGDTNTSIPLNQRRPARRANNMSHLLDILKAAMPHMDSFRQRPINTVVKAAELMNSVLERDSVGELSAASLGSQSHAVTNPELLLTSIKEVCYPREKEMVDTCLNLIKAKKLYQVYNQFNQPDKSQMFNNGYSANSPFSNGNMNMVEALKGMLTPEQSAMFDRMSMVMNTMNSMKPNSNSGTSAYTPPNNQSNSDYHTNQNASQNYGTQNNAPNNNSSTNPMNFQEIANMISQLNSQNNIPNSSPNYTNTQNQVNPQNYTNTPYTPNYEQTMAASLDNSPTNYKAYTPANNYSKENPSSKESYYQNRDFGIPKERYSNTSTQTNEQNAMGQIIQPYVQNPVSNMDMTNLMSTINTISNMSHGNSIPSNNYINPNAHENEEALEAASLQKK